MAELFQVKEQFFPAQMTIPVATPTWLNDFHFYHKLFSGIGIMTSKIIFLAAILSWLQRISEILSTIHVCQHSFSNSGVVAVSQLQGNFFTSDQISGQFSSLNSEAFTASIS